MNRHVTQVHIKFRKKKKANKNMGMSIEHNTISTYKNGDRCVWNMDSEEEENAYTCLDTHKQELSLGKPPVSWKNPDKPPVSWKKYR